MQHRNAFENPVLNIGIAIIFGCGIAILKTNFLQYEFDRVCYSKLA